MRRSSSFLSRCVENCGAFSNRCSWLSFCAMPHVKYICNMATRTTYLRKVTHTRSHVLAVFCTAAGIHSTCITCGWWKSKTDATGRPLRNLLQSLGTTGARMLSLWGCLCSQPSPEYLENPKNCVANTRSATWMGNVKKHPSVPVRWDIVHTHIYIYGFQHFSGVSFSQ